MPGLAARVAGQAGEQNYADNLINAQPESGGTATTGLWHKPKRNIDSRFAVWDIVYMRGITDEHGNFIEAKGTVKQGRRPMFRPLQPPAPAASGAAGQIIEAGDEAWTLPLALEELELVRQQRDQLLEAAKATIDAMNDKWQTGAGWDKKLKSAITNADRRGK